MYADLRGSINKIKLKEEQGVYSIYEAVVNSIQSNSKNIGVEIIKEKLPQLKLDVHCNNNEDVEEVVKEVVITDDGDGFTEENFESFNKINSTHKLKIGGKGVGRLSWLVIFEKVMIKSTYKDNGKYKYREFSFDLDNEIKKIKEEEIKTPELKNVGTIIVLQNLKPKFRKNFPSTAKKLGDKILYHCLNYLIEKTFEITIKDGTEEYKCKDEYNNKLAKLTRQTVIDIKNKQFEITHIPLPNTELKKHEIVLTADKREVKRKIVNNELYSSSFDIDGEKKSIIIYIKGKYLDEHVTEDRTNFIFPDQDNSLFISENEIINGVIEKISEIYDKQIEKILEGNREKVDKFLINNPFYKNLYADYQETYLKRMNSNTSDEQIEENFETLVREQRKSVKNNIKKLNLDEGQYNEKFELILRDIDKLNQMELAKYVTHRRIIIEFLEQILGKKDNEDKYHYEQELHNLIFPMRKTGDSVNYDEHNLWLLDDRLAYYKYIASDLPFNKIIDSENKDRMDLAIFDTPIAFSDKETYEMHSNVIIVEFKRPGRENFSTIDLEEQVYKYIEELQDRKIKTPNGRRIEVSTNSIFNVYIVCEITDTLKNQLKRGNYKLMLDEQGYYMYNENYKAFIQILSLNKILRDAQLRNKIFFKKLGI